MAHRYDLVTNYRCGDAIEEMERADDGEWIRFEDMPDYRELLSVALAQQHASLQRIASLEQQLAAAREEIRRIVRAAVE